MQRRRFLKSVYAGSAYLMGATASATATSIHGLQPFGVAWRRTYDELAISAVAPAHDGGHLLVARGGRPDPRLPVQVVRIDERGTVHQRRKIDPEGPEDMRRASADVVQTENGYAVASGPWFATLGMDLSVETTGFAAEYEPNSTTLLVERPDGFIVAAEVDTPNHVSVRVFGFDHDGNLRWTRKYGEQNSKWLDFLLDESDGGVVVGGRKPWLASIEADGTQRWQTTVTNAPPGVGSGATRDGDGFTLFGESNVVRLSESRSVEWQRTYDSFADASDGEIARTTDGGYVVAAQVALDRVRVGRTDAKGRLQWSHEYTVVEDGDAYLNDLVERAPGEYLVVGSRRDVQQGWALLLSEAETPTTRTTTSERTTTSTQTRTTSQKTTASTTTSRTEKPTNTSILGFGIGAALLGTAAGLLARRR